MANFEDLRTLKAPSTSRVKAEESLNRNFKAMVGSRLPDMLNLPVGGLEFFHVNRKETTYSEGTKSVADVRSYKFDSFDGIPGYGVPARKDQGDVKDDRKLALRLEPEGTIIIPYAQFVPVPMDHFFSYAMADIDDHLYVVTKVEQVFIIDRDWYQLTYSPSMYFKYSDIQKQVINQYEYEEDNGPGVNSPDKKGEGGVIVSKSNRESINELEKRIDEVNSKYIDTFYSEKYDALMFLSSRYLSALIPKTIKGVDLNPSWLDLYRSRKMGFMYYALMDLQENAAIMEYSIDKNILFIEPPYPLFGAKASYKGSLYDKLIKKEFRKIGSTEPDKNPFKNRTNEFSEFIGNPSGYAFEYFKAVRDGLVFDYELKDYTVEYDYTTHFYFKLYDRHTALTRFWNSGIAINYMIHNIYNEDMYEKSACVKYTLKQNIVTKFCDLYMNSKHNEIVNNLYLLDYYVFDRENLDDYIGIPMLLLVLKLTLAEFKTNRKIYKEGA